MITCKHYVEETAADFRRLFEERFPKGSDAVLDRMMANPLRGDNRPTGSIAYGEDERVVAVQGVVPRKAYCGHSEVSVALAMVMAVAQGVNRDFLTPFLKDAILSSGADLMFGNTAIPSSRRRLQEAVGSLDGPKNYEVIRGMFLRRPSAFGRRLRAVLGKLGLPVSRRAGARPIPLGAEGGLSIGRFPEIEAARFDDFWVRYRASNEGLVGSRTADEVKWVFGKGLHHHEVELVCAERDGALCVYAFLRRTDDTATCWRVADMIALRNDFGILEKLLCASADFLRVYTPAECLQITGFPDSVAPLVARLFSERVEIGFNRCVWKCLSAEASARFGNWVSDAKSWYGTPYDGDMCLV